MTKTHELEFYTIKTITNSYSKLEPFTTGKTFCLIHNVYISSLKTVSRLSMAKSEISSGKCHSALKNVYIIFKYLLTLISNIIPQ